MKSIVAGILFLSTTIFAGKFFDPPKAPGPQGSCTDTCSYLAYLQAITNQLDCKLCDRYFSGSSVYNECKELCVEGNYIGNAQIQNYQNYVKQACADQSCSSGEEDGPYCLQYKQAYNETETNINNAGCKCGKLSSDLNPHDVLCYINCRANDVWKQTIKNDENCASFKLVASGILSVVFLFLI